ncbi:glutamate receptor ionotropic, kainate 5-like [Gigantopelta aegis]|uniref:glutamate receptor ionotropic, kainate 5-like n=1 Tax=Gigantopelta aegis TaxID=1735272 RepID=UPI001B88B7DD|nr:glutamate receptor ionotropic, kainate 5-like [Gigantopelta aegis]
MEYLLPAIYYDYTDVIYKEENNEVTSWATILRPFSPAVFMAIAGSAGSFFILYVSAMALLRKTHKVRNEPKTVTDVLWFTISSLVKQGSTVKSSSQSIRVLVSSWMLFTVIIIAVYTANLTAVFSVRPVVKQFSSLGQLLDNPKYKIGVLHGSILTMILKNSSHPDYRRAWNKILKDSKDDPDVFTTNETKHVQKVIGGYYAFIRNDAGLRIFTRENCGLQRLGLSLVWQPVCLGVPKRSTLNVEFAETMKRLETSGIFNYWWNVHISQLKHITCPSRQRSVSSSITLDDIKSGFVLLGAGIGAAVLSLFIEILWNTIRRKCKIHRKIL